MRNVKLFEDWVDSVEVDPELMEMEEEEYDEYYEEDMEDEDYPDDDNWDENWSDSFLPR